MGETGIRLVLQRLAPSRVESRAALGADRGERAGRALRADVGQSRARSSPVASSGSTSTSSVEWLRGRRDADGLWTQQLYGRTTRYLGPAHGFAGCVLALGDVAGVSETLRRFAVEEDGLVNWPPLAGHAARRERRRPDPDAVVPRRAGDRRDARAISSTRSSRSRGGELTWRAGPLRKGANLCHGTAGNGYAFLALLERTGDERWLTRARAFAMHAAGQVERSRSRVRARPLHALDGRPRHRALPRRLHRRRRRAAPAVASRTHVYSTPSKNARTRCLSSVAALSS